MTMQKNLLVQTSAIEAKIGRALKFLLLPRMGIWLWISVLLLALVWFFAEHMLKVILYKAVLCTLAGFVGDKIARAMEASSRRPHELLQEAERLLARSSGRLRADADALRARAWQLEQIAQNVYHRRAIVIAAAMIAAALGS
jgi:hypothetical protein